jgi:hypothetical protein
MAGAFLSQNLVTSAVSVSATTAEASAGVSNLLDPQPRLRMRCLVGAAILVDFGGQRSVDCVAAISTNATAAALVRVRLSTTDPTGAAGDAWDSGTIPADTRVEANGNIVVVRTAGAVAGRYLLIEILDGSRAYIDVGHLAVGALWRLSRAQSYGFREGRLMLDQRERNAFTGAEFPVAALFNPRFTVFAVQNLGRTEIEAQHRDMLRLLGAVGDALWIPEVTLSQSELNRRAIWGAAAQPGDDAAAERVNFIGWSRAWRLIERG